MTGISAATFSRPAPSHSIYGSSSDKPDEKTAVVARIAPLTLLLPKPSCPICRDLSCESIQCAMGEESKKADQKFKETRIEQLLESHLIEEAGLAILEQGLPKSFQGKKNETLFEVATSFDRKPPLTKEGEKLTEAGERLLLQLAEGGLRPESFRFSIGGARPHFLERAAFLALQEGREKALIPLIEAGLRASILFPSPDKRGKKSLAYLIVEAKMEMALMFLFSTTLGRIAELSVKKRKSCLFPEAHQLKEALQTLDRLILYTPDTGEVSQEHLEKMHIALDTLRPSSSSPPSTILHCMEYELLHTLEEEIKRRSALALHTVQEELKKVPADKGRSSRVYLNAQQELLTLSHYFEKSRIDWAFIYADIEIDGRPWESYLNNCKKALKELSQAILLLNP